MLKDCRDIVKQHNIKFLNGKFSKTTEKILQEEFLYQVLVIGDVGAPRLVKQILICEIGKLDGCANL